MSQITLPYNFTPRNYQTELLTDFHRFAVAVWHRRGGKTATVLNRQIVRTQLKYSKSLKRWLAPNDQRLTDKEKNDTNIFYYFLPTYRQAKGVIFDKLIKEHVPMELVEKMNESELAIYYKNGSIQRFAGCDDIDKHRGIAPIDVVFDEYSEEDPEMWTTVIQPILRENEGTATFIFTPKGKNHSWEILQQAKQNPEQWFSSVKTVDDTKGISKKEVDEARINTPEAYFLQEYYCDFTENAGAFFRGIKECLYAADDYPNPKHFYNLGVDLAKYNDYTVLTPFDLATFRVKKQERFNQVDWNFQKMLIEAKARKYNNAQLKIDRTGVGDPIVEDLERLGLNIGEDGAIVFSASTKRDLLNNLSMLIEQKKIKIPNDPELVNELEGFQYTLSNKGKGKIEVKTRSGLHDDRVMSLALAVYGVTSPINNDIDDDWFNNESSTTKNFDRFAII